MRYNRRDFLGLASALVATSGTVPAFLERTARAADEQGPKNDRVLVVLQLTGGNDGLNTVVPFTDENYRRVRPKLHLADAKLHKLDDRVGLHPSLGGLAGLFGKEQAAVVQSVGYPNPNRSHFESMAIWHTAPSDAQLGHGRAAMADRGWLARAIDQRGSAAEQTSAAAALRIGSGGMPQALLGCRVQVPSLNDLDQLKRRGGMLRATSVREQVAGWQASPKEPANPLLSAARSSAIAVQATADQFAKISLAKASNASYPKDDLATRLRSIAQLVQAGFPTPIYFTELGRFDTHGRQANTHANLLEETGNALRAFVEDMTQHASSRPVLVLVFSEFGRRVEENASLGTDHGTAAPIFLLGNSVMPGVHGPYPDLTKLVDGDPAFAIDFRAVYGTILENWLGLASEPILGKRFESLNLLKSSTA
ncbi:MAG TPA: DUF1501 domain-containing protein [Pirellulales bacterium]|nr:DUF1501 domain-containing protein [Pirellulales bacterium]